MEDRKKTHSLTVIRESHNVPYRFPQKTSISTISSNSSSHRTYEKSMMEEETTCLTKNMFITPYGDVSQDHKKSPTMIEFSQDKPESLSVDYEFPYRAEMSEDTTGVFCTMVKMKSQINFLSTRLIKYKDVIKSLDKENSTLRHKKQILQEKLKSKFEKKKEKRLCFKWCI